MALPSSQAKRLNQFRQFIRHSIKDRVGLVAGIFIAVLYFLLAGYLPAYYIQKNFEDGETFVGLYSHIFRYGQFFGWITVLFLIRPVRHIWSSEKENKKVLLSILAIFILFPAAAVIIDFQSSNPAPYEIKPEILQNDSRLAEHFTRNVRSEENKMDYQTTMIDLLKDPNNWSYVRYLHYLAIYLHALSLLFVLSIVVWLIVYGSSEKVRQTEEYKRALVYCALTILISYLWLLMRTAFNYQRGYYFPAISNPAADYLLGAIFIVGSLVILLLLSTTFLKEFVQAVTLAGFGFACFSVFLGQWNPQKLLEIFGKEANVINYWTIFIGIAAFSGLVVLILRLKAGQHLKPSTTKKVSPEKKN